jgi:hypothetical protein
MTTLINVSICYPNWAEDAISLPEGMLPSVGDELDLRFSRKDERAKMWIVQRIRWYCAVEASNLFRPVFHLVALEETL